MVTTIPDNVLDVIDALEEGENLNAKLTRLAESEIRRRLARYELTARLMQAKYGMTLQEFEAQGVVARSGYTWEVENDHQDWDLAVDGIRAMRETMIMLAGMPQKPDSPIASPSRSAARAHR